MKFLVHKVFADCPPVIIEGTDQLFRDWQRILKSAGLMKQAIENHYEVIDPVVKIWHRETNEASQNALIFADSFATLISPLGLNENTDEFVEPVHNLLERK